MSCGSSADDLKKKEDYKRNHPSAFKIFIGLPNISPDSKTLILNYGPIFWTKIATYSLITGEIHKYDKLPTKHSKFPAYSRDGKRIVFLGANDELGSARNIFIMNADGSNIRQITHSPPNILKEAETGKQDFIKAPSFSPDGKRIIFARSHKARKQAYPLNGTMDCDWDIYEVDIDTGVERRLTNYNFYYASYPYYMPDGKRFIFSGEALYDPTGKSPKDFKEYEALYKKNYIFIMDSQQNELKPALINGQHSFKPSVSKDGTILFISKTNEIDGLKLPQDNYDLFIYKHGKIKRLTKLNSKIRLAQISLDGKYVIFEKEQDYEISFRMLKSDGTGLKEIKYPVDELKSKGRRE